MRQYGEVPPWVGTGPAPTVQSVTGLGTGGGAGVDTDDGSGFGDVLIQTGSNPSAGGNIVLAFSVVPPLLFISGDGEFGALIVTNNPSAAVTITWAATLPPGRKLRLNYEWSVSK